jgi:tRNA pseudouridine38-40 synthase
VTLFDEEPTAPTRGRVRATVAYDGTDFAGFAAQNDGPPTVGATLADAIGRVLGEQVELTCAGRTDAGVHAWGQVVSFDAERANVDTLALERAVNKMLRPAIAIREIEVVDSDFDARFSARSRRYRYTILNQPTPSPFLAATSWWIDRPLDLRAMRLACDPLIGEHDFSAFCRRPSPEATLVRRVLDARWDAVDSDLGCRLEFWIEANAFCHQMVRSIVGTMVDVGVGRRRAGEVSALMRSLDRSQAGNVAPPHGLCLWSVTY